MSSPNPFPNDGAAVVNFENVRLGFDAHGLQAMELTDNFGQNTVLRFSKLKRNPKVNAAEFRFEPPKGADVLGEK